MKRGLYGSSCQECTIVLLRFFFFKFSEAVFRSTLKDYGVFNSNDGFMIKLYNELSLSFLNAVPSLVGFL